MPTEVVKKELEGELVEPSAPAAKQLGLVEEFGQYGAFPRLMAEVFEEVGGRAYLKEVAEDQPKFFLTLFSKAQPGLMPRQGMQGDISITINNHLTKTALDD